MIADRLKAWRDELCLSQEDVARMAGVAQNTWSAWEREAPSQMRALARVAREGGVSADYLLGLTDYKPLDTKTLPEGSSVLLDYYSEMSPRGRDALFAVARTLHVWDQDWREREQLTLLAIQKERAGELKRLGSLIRSVGKPEVALQTLRDWLNKQGYMEFEGDEQP